MRKISDAHIYKMVHMILDKEYRRLVGERYFQGIITDIPHPGVVRVQRLGESAPDDTDHICTIPGYVPAIGDRVELVWADSNYAYVAFPLVTSSVPIPVLVANPNGPWPVSLTFTFSRPGLALVEYSASAFTTTGGTLSWPYSIDGVSGTHNPIMAATNGSNVRLTCPTGYDVFGSPAGAQANNPSSGKVLAAGKHTFTLSFAGGNTDGNDRAFVKISRLDPNATFS